MKLHAAIKRSSATGVQNAPGQPLTGVAVSRYRPNPGGRPSPAGQGGGRNPLNTGPGFGRGLSLARLLGQCPAVWGVA
jgi:hypothetical protein